MISPNPQIPIISIPLLAALYWNQKKALKIHSPVRERGLRHHILVLKQVDLLGLLLFSIGLSLLLVPVTLAASTTRAWVSGHIIAMLILGVSFLVAFVIWEARWAKWPVVAAEVLKDRTVLSGIIGMILLAPAIHVDSR